MLWKYLELICLTLHHRLQCRADRKELLSGRQLIEGYQLWGKEHEPTSWRRMPLSVLGERCERCDSCYLDQDHQTIQGCIAAQHSVVTSGFINHHWLGGLGGWDNLQFDQTLTLPLVIQPKQPQPSCFCVWQSTLTWNWKKKNLKLKRHTGLVVPLTWYWSPRPL